MLAQQYAAAAPSAAAPGPGEPADSPPPGMPAAGMPAAAAPKGSKPKHKGSKPKRKASAAEAEAANMSAIADYVHELEPEEPLPTGAAYEAAMAAAKSAFVGNWRCWWCGCREAATCSTAAGPDGDDQLCYVCSKRYKAGAAPPILRPEGGYECALCGRGCPTIELYHLHAPLCEAVHAARHPQLHDTSDDTVFFARKLAVATQGQASARALCLRPPLSTKLDPRIPRELFPDVLGISENLHRYGAALALPHMSVHEIIQMATTGREERGTTEAQLWLRDEVRTHPHPYLPLPPREGTGHSLDDIHGS